jgi:hypothetical protein
MKTYQSAFSKLIVVCFLVMCALAFNSCQSGSDNVDLKFKIIMPIDGDMLNDSDGVLSDGGLTIKVKIAALAGSKIKVNGTKAKYIDGNFEAYVVLSEYENVIEVSDRKQEYKKSMTVFWLKNYVNKYRFSVDDNIRFLEDITKNSDKYRSIFENPYLGLMKEVHDTYGTKIHFNLFYSNESFNLSRMTDKYKEEWKANADWLKLSFHSLGEFPDRPYIAAGYDQVNNDCKLVKEQILRFAGEEVMSQETTLHWGEGTKEACRALKDNGYKILAGYFNVDDEEFPVSYYLNMEQKRHISERFIWRDNEEGIIFSRIAQVVNTVSLDQVVPYLDNVREKYNPRYIDLMIHEQYFYPDYDYFQPDYREKVMISVKWAVDNGYSPAFLTESIINGSY